MHARTHARTQSRGKIDVGRYGRHSFAPFLCGCTLLAEDTFNNGQVTQLAFWLTLHDSHVSRQTSKLKSPRNPLLASNELFTKKHRGKYSAQIYPVHASLSQPFFLKFSSHSFFALRSMVRAADPQALSVFVRFYSPEKLSNALDSRPRALHLHAAHLPFCSTLCHIQRLRSWAPRALDTQCGKTSHPP